MRAAGRNANANQRRPFDIRTPGEVRLRRSRCLICYWDAGRLTYHNYLTGTKINAAPVVTAVLDFFTDWTSPEKLRSAWPDHSWKSISRTLIRLAALSFLEIEGSEDPRSAAISAWENWSPTAAFFHLSTKDVRYVTDVALREREIRRRIREDPQPSFTKFYSGNPVVPLNRNGLPGKSEFVKVLNARRTWREFSKKPLALEDLAKLLDLTWGVRKYLAIRFLGRLPLKTSPSAGARNPIEVYVAALRVKGLARGLYHYSSEQHDLRLLQPHTNKRQIVRFLGGQYWYGGAAAVFFMTAVFPRQMWKYRYPRSYRSVLLDAGHLCQTFCLTATWLGLAPFCTAALADSLIEKELGIDGITESVLYAAGVGEQP